MDEFWDRLWQSGGNRLAYDEPAFTERIGACKKLNLPYGKCCSESTPLLTGRFNGFANLLEALHEVRYYWKRLSEVERLFRAADQVGANPHEVEPPITENEWFIYHLDYWWQVTYSLFERFNKFLTQVERRLEVPQNAELRTYLKEVKQAAQKTSDLFGKGRHQIAHHSSQGMQGLKADHVWETEIALGIANDKVAMYDEAFMLHRDFYEERVPAYTSMIRDFLDMVFPGLLLRVPFDKIR
ncbi:MAG: hypothetical protein PHO26_07275 [Dehalococcoidia bacterium]|nr:hypothetical protein [Dehalococcoidia bacterium]MDD5494138.1 hypothetical protein [Dehalococcoidia bacterium]